MKIVVVGAGKLGYSVAEILSQEDHDVVVTDHVQNQLVAVENTLDVLTLFHNGGISSLFLNPDVMNADMLIAATGTDEVNMALSSLAKAHGITRTVARIRDVADGEKDRVMETFKIDLVLNPELLIATEIHRILMAPAALNVEDFAHGKVRLFEVKIKKKSKVLGKTLKEITLPEGVLAAMIFRGQRMIIPHGDDSFQLNDDAYFIGIPEQIEKFSENFRERKSKKIEKVMIIGAGRSGRRLTRMLDTSGVKVKLVDIDEERLRLVAGDLSNNSMAILGDGTDIDLLIEEEVASADFLIALTEDDKLNLMLALLAKHLRTAQTVVRFYRTDYISIMEKAGVDVALSARHLAATEVLAFARQGGVRKVSYLDEGLKAEAVEVVVQNGAKVAGKTLMEAKLPRECLVSAYVREGVAKIPRGNTVLEAGDRVILILESSAAKKVMEFFR
ncbi:MAG: Trk system potassium transporter TrkA [Selenomonadaceae bacterium]|nr:Trk system potassium transporter TrkA [Selenomonadaceae bacterium]